MDTVAYQSSAYSNQTISVVSTDTLGIKINRTTGCSGTITIRETNGSGRTITSFTYSAVPYNFEFDDLSGRVPATTNVITMDVPTTLHMTFTPSDGTTGYTIYWVKNSVDTVAYQSGAYSNQTISLTATQTIAVKVNKTSAGTGTITIRETDGSGRTVTVFDYSVVTELYTFTTHTFTNAGVTGSAGPTLAQCKTAYSASSWTQNSSFFNMTVNGIQI